MTGSGLKWLCINICTWPIYLIWSLHATPKSRWTYQICWKVFRNSRDRTKNTTNWITFCVCVFVCEVPTGHIVPTNSERYIKYLVSVVIMSFYNLWIIDLFNLALINQRSTFFSASKWKRPIGKTPFSLIWSQLLLLIFACNWILGNNSLFNFYVIAVCSVENIYSNVWNPFGIVWRIQSRLTTQYT